VVGHALTYWGVEVGRKTPPFPNHPDWTTARFFGFLRSGLREKFNRYPPKYEALRLALELVNDGEFKSGPKKGLTKVVKKYKCASCKSLFMQKDVQVDHIVPAGSLKTFEDLPGFTSRLFCAADDLQIMCKACHSGKTKEDNS